MLTYVVFAVVGAGIVVYGFSEARRPGSVMQRFRGDLRRPERAIPPVLLIVGFLVIGTISHPDSAAAYAFDIAVLGVLAVVVLQLIKRRP